MRSRTLFALAAVAGVAACSAEATAPPREELPRPSLLTAGGCPGGYAEVEVVPGTFADLNQDGLICVLTFQPAPDVRTIYFERDNKT